MGLARVAKMIPEVFVTNPLFLKVFGKYPRFSAEPVIFKGFGCSGYIMSKCCEHKLPSELLVVCWCCCLLFFCAFSQAEKKSPLAQPKQRTLA